MKLERIVLVTGKVCVFMKKILFIIFLSSILFSAGFIIGTGGLGSKYSLQNIDSIQKKTIELGYTSVIEFQTVLNQIEILIAASEENIEATVNQFRNEQVKIMVAGLVNYKNANNSQPKESSDNQSVLLEEPPFLVTKQKNDSVSKEEIIVEQKRIDVTTTSASTEQQIEGKKVNRNRAIMNKGLE